VGGERGAASKTWKLHRGINKTSGVVSGGVIGAGGGGGIDGPLDQENTAIAWKEERIRAGLKSTWKSRGCCSQWCAPRQSGGVVLDGGRDITGRGNHAVIGFRVVRETRGSEWRGVKVFCNIGCKPGEKIGCQ